MTLDEIKGRAERARRNPVVLRDGRPVVSLECDDVDYLLKKLAEAVDLQHAARAVYYEFHGRETYPEEVDLRVALSTFEAKRD